VAIAARGDSVFETWPTGYARNPAFGTHWDMTGPGITPAKPPAVRSTIGNGQTLRDQVNEAANNFSTVDLQADVIRFEILGYGSIRTDDGREAPVSTLYGKNLCTRPKGCTCPTNSAGSHVTVGNIPKGPILLGVTGGADAAAFAIAGLSVQDFCHTKPNTTVPGVVGPPPTTCLCPDFGFPKPRR
jgi:hypothetical protein